MSSPTLVPATPLSEPSLVLFGRDGTGKPRASWFDTGSADPATKPSDPLRMCAVTVETEEPKALALPLAG